VLLQQVVVVDGVNAVVNYGLNRVRFPAPVPVGARLRGHVTLAAAAQRGPAIEAAFGLTIDRRQPSPGVRRRTRCPLLVRI
jgi:acyl dehydratase